MPGWIRKNGAYRQIGVPTHYELASATLLTGGAGYDTTMELVILPVETGDQEAVISIDEVNDSGAITSSHISARGKFSAETDITNATLVVRESGEVIGFQGTDATFTLLAEDYTGLDSAVFIRKNGAWRPCSAGYMRRENAWRQIYLPAQAQENPPEPVSDIAVKYMAIDPDGTVLTSDNGYDYSSVGQVEDTSTTGRILFYADGYYYTAIHNGTVNAAKRSRDGVTWENLTLPAINCAVFAYGGGEFVFAGMNNNLFYYTSDPVGTWSSFYIAGTGLDWNSLVYADLGSGNQYWYVSAATSTTAYRFKTNGTKSALTLGNKKSYGKIGVVNGLVYYPYYWSGYATPTSRVKTFIETHFVSWDGITFSAIQTYGSSSSAAGAGSKNELVYNNNVYCSNRSYQGFYAYTYVADNWVQYSLTHASYLLAVLSGNFCSFYSSALNSTYVTKSSDGQSWTVTQPTLPQELVAGALGFPVKVGLRVYWTNYIFQGAGAGSTYPYSIGSADGSNWTLLTGLTPSKVDAAYDSTADINAGKNGYAFASKMG